MPKLFVEATNNDQPIRQLFETATRSLPDPSKLQDFCVGVRTSGRLSINMRPHVVGAVLSKGYYENIYQQAKKLSGISKRSVEQELRRLLGEYFSKRIALDAALEIPDTIYYAAVNLGGLGAPKYGSFCVILNGLAVDQDKAVFVASDSLQNYVDDNANVNVAGLIANACSKLSLPELCCLKHAGDPLIHDSLSWSRMACNDNTYVEAIVDEQLTPTSIAEIRIARTEYDALMDLALGGMYGKTRGNADRALAQDFLEIVAQAEAYKIPLNAMEITA
ncbi:hypothetical protein [Neorhizobium sp. T25_27]|uniref:hypothetical protein n=1 Tax=Neorhizobium sp. T25_27 TaxID=2093831 RepID=UPI000CF8C886|nr:hypothetical protein [Neorhizobium sp. T25_27]